MSSRASTNKNGNEIIATTDNTNIIFSRDMEATWEREIIARRSDTALTVLVFAGKMPERASYTMRLKERGARGEIISVYLGTDATRSDIRITVVHEAPDTWGRVTFRAALRDRSRLDFSGMLRIMKGADGSDSYLSAKALMLSESAIARFDPQLEILANAVKASHGATVGCPPEEVMVYLRSRGLSKVDAERICVQGLFSDILPRLPERVTQLMSF